VGSAITASRQLGSTLAADAGSRSIGFQFHRAHVIDAARTGPCAHLAWFRLLKPVAEFWN